MTDDELFKPLSAKVGRQTFSVGGRPMSGQAARLSEDHKIAAALRRRRELVQKARAKNVKD